MSTTLKLDEPVIDTNEVVVEMYSELVRIAKKVVRRRASMCVEAEELVSEAVAGGYFERWTASYDAESARDGIKSWMRYKFRLYCGDRARERKYHATLRYNPNRPGEETRRVFRAVSLDESYENIADRDATAEEVSDEVAHVLSVCTDKEAFVLKAMFIDQRTRTDIASELGCHANTISALRKSGVAKIQRQS